MPDYLHVIYDSKSHPYTDYPSQLAGYLAQAYGLSKEMKIVEIGCGRGEFLRNFQKLGLEAKGVDISKEAPALSPDLDISVCDVETQNLPFPDNHFDVVFTKSVMEHIKDTDKFMVEALRVLKPGGKLLCMVPDWEANYKIFFDDYTHKSPFTIVSLKHLFEIYDLKNVNVFKFRQLPLVWRHPWLNYLCAIIGPFIPVRTRIGFLRWSRELMLVAYGQKQL